MRALIDRLGIRGVFALAALLVIGLAGTAGWLFSQQDKAQPVASAPASAVIEMPRLDVEAVDIAGHVETSEEDILRAVGLNAGIPNALQFDAAAARERILALPWVKEVAVRVATSGILYISVNERKAAAVWQDISGHWLIDEDGKTLVEVAGPEARVDLPLLIGPGAPEAINDARALLYSAPQPMLERITALVRKGNRRWDAILISGLRVKLPAEDALTALRRFHQQGLERRVASKAVTAIDMRRPDEPIVLALEPGAPAMRLEMLDSLREAR